MAQKLETISIDYAIQLMKIIVFNEKRITALSDWLQKCVEKRIQKGQPVTVEHLANCGTMKRIGFLCKGMVEKFEKKAVSNDARRVFQYELAQIIFDDAKSEVEYASTHAE